MQHAPFIHSLRKQQQILEDLISRFSEREKLGETDCRLYDVATQKVEKNLKRLRKSLLEGIHFKNNKKEEKS